jgi:hypothetical protein
VGKSRRSDEWRNGATRFVRDASHPAMTARH